MSGIKNLLPLMQLVRLEGGSGEPNLKVSYVIQLNNYVLKGNPIVLPEVDDLQIIEIIVKEEEGSSTPLSDTANSISFEANNPNSADGKVFLKVIIEGNNDAAATSAMNYDDADDPQLP